MSGLDDNEAMKAAEYALGTLDAAERAAFEAAMARDSKLADAARDWANILAPLAQGVPEVSPPEGMFVRIEQHLPSPAPPLRLASTDDVVRLRRLLAGWRRIGLVSSALAASLGVALLVRHVSVPAPAPNMLAVLSPKGAQAPLVVRVEAGARQVVVAAASIRPPAGRSLELWYIAKGQKPLAMGFIDQTRHVQALPASATDDEIRGAIFAVTVEPPGGGPNGQPTGPIVYSGPVSID
ncbi:MAG: anti-sigma factor [Hyphomicrobiales bacterium]|nr:anti-sigma factor [Hyphomicrobiales bacterium]